MKDYFLLFGNLFLLGYFSFLVYRGVKEKRKWMVILFSIGVILEAILFFSRLNDLIS